MWSYSNTMRFYFFSCLLLTVIGCRAVPITDRTQLMLTTSGYENELGVTAYAEYKAKYRRSGNAEYNQALARCGRAISQAAEQDDFDWEFTVLDTNIQNAFCLPGGKVAVYSGLMDVMNNEAELACIVAHEVAHAIARHGGELKSWGYLQKLGTMGIAPGFNNEPPDNIGTGTKPGVMLNRIYEYEADLIGLILMAKAGYNPKAAIHFWTRFSKLKAAAWSGMVVSTHPCDADRIQNFHNNMYLAEDAYKKARNKKGFGVTFTR